MMGGAKRLEVGLERAPPVGGGVTLHAQTEQL
jgi:hypothetical protein